MNDSLPYSELIGNVLDHWEQLPNDLRSDPGFEALNNALTNLYKAVTQRSTPTSYPRAGNW